MTARLGYLTEMREQRKPDEWASVMEDKKNELRDLKAYNMSQHIIISSVNM